MSQAGGPNSVGGVNIDFTGNVAPLEQAAKQAEQVVTQAASKMQSAASGVGGAGGPAQADTREYFERIRREAKMAGESVETNLNRPIYRLGETISQKVEPAWDKLFSKFKGTLSRAFIPLAIIGIFERLGATIARVTESSGSRLDKFYATLNPTNQVDWIKGLQSELDAINGKIAQLGDEQNNPFTKYAGAAVHFIREGETMNSLLEQQAALYEKIAVALQAQNSQTQKEAGKKKQDERKKEYDAEKAIVEQIAEIQQQADRDNASAFGQAFDEREDRLKAIKKIAGDSEDQEVKNAAQIATEAVMNAYRYRLKLIADEDEKARQEREQKEKESANRIRDIWTGVWRDIAQEQVGAFGVGGMALDPRVGDALELRARQNYAPPRVIGGI
jgi:hypothetical protein